MKKSIVISLLTIITLFCTALCSFASTGIVTTDTLRLRKEPSTDSTVLKLLSINDQIEILEEEKHGWYKVKAGGDVGYVAAQYINVLTEANKTNQNLNKDTNNEASGDTDLNTNTQNQVNNENNNQEPPKTTDVVNSVTVLAAQEDIYITPLINSLSIAKTNEEKQIEIVSEINGWSYIKLGITTGWVRTEKIQRKEIIDNNSDNSNNNNNSSQKYGYVTIDSVNFRKAPNTSSEIITKLPRNAKLTIITPDDGWAEVEYNGNRGYISTTYISDTPIETTSRSSEPRTSNKAKSVTQKTTVAETKEEIISVSSENATGASIVEYAKKYLGYKYTPGGSTPKNGFDCSGFTTYIFKHFGISLSRTSSGQGSNGIAVAKSSMQIGDIICFSSSASSKKIGHVGIYVGGGKFIHSANSRKGVIISNVNGDGYYFVTARRLI